MYEEYWSRFLRTGSVEDYLRYRKGVSLAAKQILEEVADGKSTVEGERDSTAGTSDEGKR